MFEKPAVPLIDRLHRYGRELAVLKRIYQNYALIIERILERRKSVSLTGDRAVSQVTSNGTIGQVSTNHQATDEEASSETAILGAPLCSAATVRFERLRDRINQFALSEIQECLEEKEQLVFLVSND